MRNTKHLKKFLSKGSWVILASFLLLGSTAVYALEIPLLNFEGFKNKENLSLKEQGLNEYRDPKEHPLYNKKYNEISFEESGLSQRELEMLLEIIFGSEEYNVSVNYSEGGAGKSFDQISSVESLRSAVDTKITNDDVIYQSLSFNSKLDNYSVERINYLRGKDSIREMYEGKVVQIEEELENERFESYLSGGDQAILDTYNTSFKELSRGDYSVPEDISKEEAPEILSQIEQKKGDIRITLENELKVYQEKLTQHEEVVSLYTDDWEVQKNQLKFEEKMTLEKIGLSVSFVNSEIIEAIYPTNEQIDKLNQEILEEREVIDRYNLKNPYHKTQVKEEISSFFRKTVNAGNLNNFVASLVVYPRSQQWLRIDLSGNGVYNGNFFHMYAANGGSAQKFKFDDGSKQIKYNANQGYCMDIDLNGGYSNGDKVQIWQCHSGNNQKWVARPDGTIRPASAQGYCLDVDTAMEQGRRLQIWQCNGQNNQSFQIGEEDFDVFQYHMRLHASKTGSVNNNLTGHALISMPKKQYSNNHWHITNTFSFWGDMPGEYRRDGKDNIHKSNSGGRTNNMRNVNLYGGWSSLSVDNGGGNQTTDWSIGTAHPADAGGEFGGYRRTTSSLTKQRYEEIKYMNGYQIDGYISKNWFPTCQTCASYSVALWNPYTSATNYGGCWTPGAIYNTL